MERFVVKNAIIFFFAFTLMFGCASNKDRIQTDFLTETCIKPLIDYRYLTCDRIYFTVDNKGFSIPANFETDLASIPKIAWLVMAPSHSSLIRPAIVHDWFYRKSCAFNRKQSDLIFYHMLRNDGISKTTASIMYYTVRWFGWNFYNEDDCNGKHKHKRLDKIP